MGSVHEPELNGPIVYRCAQAGCAPCMRRLLRYHRGLVLAVIKRQSLGEVLLEDAIQEGMVALWKAIRRFDPTRGVAFSTYAWVVIERRIWRVVEQQGGGGFLPLVEAVDSLQTLEERRGLAEALAKLPGRLGAIMVAAYGLDGTEPRTYADIGRQLGVSRELVRYCHNRALALLRTPVFCLPLREVWERHDRVSYQQVAALLRAWQRQQRAARRQRATRQRERGR